MSIIAVIDGNNKSDLEFELDISGSKAKPSDIRFIIEDNEFALLCRCELNSDEKTITVHVPKLLAILKGGTYNAKLQVVVEDKLFTPIDEEIIIETPIFTKAKIIPEQKNEPNVTVKYTLPSHSNKTDESAKTGSILKDVKKPQTSSLKNKLFAIKEQECEEDKKHKDNLDNRHKMKKMISEFR